MGIWQFNFGGESRAARAARAGTVRAARGTPTDMQQQALQEVQEAAKGAIVHRTHSSTIITGYSKFSLGCAGLASAVASAAAVLEV